MRSCVVSGDLSRPGMKPWNGANLRLNLAMAIDEWVPRIWPEESILQMLNEPYRSDLLGPEVWRWSHISKISPANYDIWCMPPTLHLHGGVCAIVTAAS